jgi:ADP-heptose:LPS heptosyltransferase
MKILIIKHGSLGDLVLSFGAIKTLQHHYTKDELYLLTQPNYKNIFNKLPYVKEIFTDNRSNIILSIIKYLKLIKKNKFDLIIDLQNSTRTQIYHLFTRLFTNTQILSARYFSNIKYQQQIQGVQHITQNHKDQLRKLNIHKYFSPDLNWMSLKKNHKNNYVILIPGTSKTGSYKKWPSQKFAEIANYLINMNLDVYLTGSQLDIKDIHEIIDICPKAQNKINESKIELFFDLCLGSNLIISNDTGPAHIAGLSNKPLIWLANDNKISKSCYPLGDNVHKIIAEDVKSIKTEQVLEKIEQII